MDFTGIEELQVNWVWVVLARYGPMLHCTDRCWLIRSVLLFYPEFGGDAGLAWYLYSNEFELELFVIFYCGCALEYCVIRMVFRGVETQLLPRPWFESVCLA